RMALVNGFDAELRVPAGTFALSSQRYAGEVLHPDGASRIVGYEPHPWPTWTFALPGGLRVEQQISCAHGRPLAALSWRLKGRFPATGILSVRLFLSGRDAHQLHRENPAFRFETAPRRGGVAWRPYDGVPGIAAFSTGRYLPAPEWYRSFLYTRERE